MSDITVSTEVAEAEYERFCDLMDLDIDVDGLDEDDQKELEDKKRVLVKAICKGHLTVSDAGEPTVRLKIPVDEVSEITFHEPDGSTILVTDKVRKDRSAAKLFEVMANLTGQPAHVFGKLKMRDMRVCQAVTTLFLG